MEKVLRHIYICESFLSIHTYPPPSPPPGQPHKQRWTSASDRVSTLYRWREGEQQEDFEKDALFY